jgi:hypothetical protein
MQKLEFGEFQVPRVADTGRQAFTASSSSHFNLREKRRQKAISLNDSRDDSHFSNSISPVISLCRRRSNICKTSAFNPFTQWPLSLRQHPASINPHDDERDREGQKRPRRLVVEMKNFLSRATSATETRPSRDCLRRASCLAKGLERVDKCFRDEMRRSEISASIASPIKARAKRKKNGETCWSSRESQESML